MSGADPRGLPVREYGHPDCADATALRQKVSKGVHRMMTGRCVHSIEPIIHFVLRPFRGGTLIGRGGTIRRTTDIAR